MKKYGTGTSVADPDPVKFSGSDSGSDHKKSYNNLTRNKSNKFNRFAKFTFFSNIGNQQIMKKEE